MPLYPYRCTKCGHRFEKIQSFNSEPETTCPKCGGVLERTLTAPGLQFKGAGWYVTDYSSKSGGSGSGGSGSDGSGSGEAGTKPSESPAPAESKSSGSSKDSASSASAGSTSASSSESKS